MASLAEHGLRALRKCPSSQCTFSFGLLKTPRELSDYMGGRLWGLGGGLQEKSSKGTSFKRISLWSQWSLWFKVVIEINQRMPTKVFGNPECLKV
jgi:hypothetical protein